MRRGCLFGCLFFVLVLGAGVFGVGYLVGRMGLTEMSPRVDTVAHAGGRPAVLIHVDPNADAARELLGVVFTQVAGAWRIVLDKAVPHEGTLALEPDRETGEVSSVFALSLRRLGPLLEWRGGPELWRWWVAQRLDSWRLERDGLWVVRSHLPISEEASAEADARWVKPPGQALSLEGGHTVEVLLDNRGGRAFLALDAILSPPLQAGDVPETRPVQMNSAQWASFFERIETAWLTLDMDTPEHARAVLQVQAPDETKARAVMFALLLVRDTMQKSLARENLELDGVAKREGTVVQMVFELDGVRPWVTRRLGLAGA